LAPPLNHPTIFAVTRYFCYYQIFLPSFNIFAIDRNQRTFVSTQYFCTFSGLTINMPSKEYLRLRKERERDANRRESKKISQGGELLQAY